MSKQCALHNELLSDNERCRTRAGTRVLRRVPAKVNASSSCILYWMPAATLTVNYPRIA